MAVKSKLESYLQNEPLTPRLRALAETVGENEENEISSPSPLAIVRRVGEFSDVTRDYLRELKGSAGWDALLTLWADELEKERKIVEAMSLSDPLGNESKIAQGWAYVAMMKRVRHAICNRLDAELQKLDEDERGHS